MFFSHLYNRPIIIIIIIKQAAEHFEYLGVGVGGGGGILHVTILC